MIIKEMTVIVVHGDKVEENVQTILDRKSARNSSINPLGFHPSNHELTAAGSPHDMAVWTNRPMATCNALVVAGDPAVGHTDRIEISVHDFAELEGIRDGTRIRITIEPID